MTFQVVADFRRQGPSRRTRRETGVRGRPILFLVVWSCPVLPCTVLSCHVLSCSVQCGRPVMPCPVLFSHASSGPVMSSPVLSYRGPSCLTTPALSIPIPSCSVQRSSASCSLLHVTCPVFRLQSVMGGREAGREHTMNMRTTANTLNGRHQREEVVTNFES